MNNRVIKNASWIIGCKIAQSVLNLIISMLSARYLGPSNYGLITYAASVVAFILPIMQLGFSKTLVQDLIEHPDKEGHVLGTALTMNLVSAVACMIGVYGFLRISNPNDNLAVIVGVLYSISLIFQATEILQYWFQAKLLSKYTSIASLIAYVLAAAYKLFLLISKKPITWFAIYNSLDYMLISVFLIVVYHKLGNQKLGFSLKIGREMLHRSKHYILSMIMVTIFQQTDRIMLKHMISETETGYYSAAVACVGVTSFIFTAIEDSVRPTILEAKHNKTSNYETLVIGLYSVITYLALTQSIAITILAKPVIHVLYGSAYVGSIVPLRIAVWYTTFSYYGSVRNIWILAEGKQKYLWIINLSGAFANVLINAWLIPSMGAVGAAIASLITQFFTNVIVGYLIPPIRYNNTLMLKGLNPRPLVKFTQTYINKLKKR